MIWTIDRIENGIAVIETPTGIFNIEIKHLPQELKEGNKLILKIDKNEEECVNERINIKMKKLFLD